MWNGIRPIAVPRALRNRASLAVIALAVVAGGWGLFAALSSGDSIERREPVAAVSQGDADVSSPFSSGSDVSDPEPSAPDGAAEDQEPVGDMSMPEATPDV